MQKSPLILSDYARTYNNVIDLVAEAAGWAKKKSPRKVAAIVLKPMSFMQFCAGVEVLMKREMTEEEKHGLTFQGIKILKGGMAQFDTLKIEYVDAHIKLRKHNA